MGRGEPKVLVIGDSDMSLELMAGVLQDASLQVVKLAGPIGATQTVVDRGINVLVTDANAAEVPGHNLVSLFRGNRRTEHVMVVLVSSLPEHRLSQVAAECSADGFVEKDRLKTDLVPLVKRLVQTARPARSGDKARPRSA